MLAVIARRRAVGYNYAYLDWTEGMARYFLGQKEAGIGLARHAVERGFVGRLEYWQLLEPQYQPLINDPAFAPVMAIQEANATSERDKFLAIVCNGGNPAPQVWTPKPETCAGYVES